MRDLGCWTIGAVLVATAGCFDPDSVSADTDTDGATTTGQTSPTGPTVGTTTTQTTTTASTTATTGPTSTTATTAGSTSGSDESSTGEGAPDWGEGDPPDFGDLGPDGDGVVLAVHALSIDGPVDVWLVGDAAPLATGLERGAAVVLPPVGRAPRRIVFARSGTTEAVGCSDWFPLRAEEQWATIGARAEHTCPTPANGGGTIAFEQELALTGNTVRFVHAAAADDFTLRVSDQPQAGTLTPLGTLAAADLPDCATSGCTVGYALEAAALARRDFTFLTPEVTDVPPAGEVMFVAVGDLREDWPNQPDALDLIVVDVEGTTRSIARDPELTVVAPLASNDVVFSVVALPPAVNFATVSPCTFGRCDLPTQRFPPATLEFIAQESGQASVNASFTLEAGRRYVMMAYPGQLALIADDFDRTDARIAVGRAYNTEPTSTLSLGQTFNNMPQPFAAFTSIPPNTLSATQELPLGSWTLLSALDAQPLTIGCFNSVTTDARWRGLLSAGFAVALDAWPPAVLTLGLTCF